MDLFKKIVVAIAVIMAAVMIGLFIMSLAGCMFAPNRKDFSNDECFNAADCLYRIKDGKEKSACSMLLEACRDSMKEGRTFKRMEYCRDNKFGGLTESECRYFLNQK